MTVANPDSKVSIVDVFENFGNTDVFLQGDLIADHVKNFRFLAIDSKGTVSANTLGNTGPLALLTVENLGSNILITGVASN